MLGLNSLLVVGDMNFSLGTNEVWGAKARIVPLTTFNTQWMEAYAMIDVTPHTLAPTWRNEKTGGKGISKLLDRFLLS